jgi:hypothetical protein
MLGELGSMMGDHQVGATGVTSHGDGVVDRRPDTGVGCRWYTRGGSVKHEAEATCDAGWGVECRSYVWRGVRLRSTCNRRGVGWSNQANHRTG